MTRININNRRFTALFNSVHGQVNQETVFHYFQEGKLLWAKYSGGEIIIGSLSGYFIDESHFYIRYGHFDQDNEYRSGHCHSTIELLGNGKLRIHEKWRWDDSDEKGESTLISLD